MSPRITWLALYRQDTRSARLARGYGVLGTLMAAEQLGDVLGPACRTADGRIGPADRTARAALDVLWRTLYGSGHGTASWNPGVLHLRQADELRRWQHAAGVGKQDIAALLRVARRLAADELDHARAGRRAASLRPAAAVPST